MLGVNLHIYWTVRGTSILDPPGPDSGHNLVELLLAHTKTVVLYGKRTVCLVEIESQSLIHVNGTKGSDSRFRPRDIQKEREQFRRSSSIPGWNYRVVKLNSHRAHLSLRFRPLYVEDGHHRIPGKQWCNFL